MPITRLTNEQYYLLKTLQMNLSDWYAKNQQYLARTRYYKFIAIMSLLSPIFFYLFSTQIESFTYRDELFAVIFVLLLILFPGWVIYMAITQRRITRQYSFFFNQFFNLIKKHPEIYILYQKQFEVTSNVHAGRDSVTMALLALDFQTEN